MEVKLKDSVIELEHTKVNQLYLDDSAKMVLWWP